LFDKIDRGEYIAMYYHEGLIVGLRQDRRHHSWPTFHVEVGRLRERL
jgi:hypothetical protein